MLKENRKSSFALSAGNSCENIYDLSVSDLSVKIMSSVSQKSAYDQPKQEIFQLKNPIEN